MALPSLLESFRRLRVVVHFEEEFPRLVPRDEKIPEDDPLKPRRSVEQLLPLQLRRNDRFANLIDRHHFGENHSIEIERFRPEIEVSRNLLRIAA